MLKRCEGCCSNAAWLWMDVFWGTGPWCLRLLAALWEGWQRFTDCKHEFSQNLTTGCCGIRPFSIYYRL